MNILLIIRLTLIHCLFTLVRAKLKQNVDDSVVSISADFYNDIINQYSNNYNSYEHVSQCSFGFQRYRPNRKNCNHFYVCNTENQYQTIGQQSRESSVLIGVCPPNMWFDADHSDNDEVICTHYEVICASKHTEMYNYCNCKAIKATASSTGHQQANIETDDSLNEESISCIVDNEFHLFESEKYCERYYICFNTKVYPMKCKPGLHFNPTMKYCDVPEKAQCKLMDQECPPTGISLIAHPHDCNAFYYCYFGKKTHQMCEFYHVWDDKLKSCVRRDQATCHLNKLQ